ncbi:MAG TPA: hypothetical protein VFI25_18880 [Planctomycetota bacterium]|nr:hypothetical protein [Planctomycetota bacterium]
MLARLDAVEGVEASRVDWTGKRVLLDLEPGADASRAIAEAKEVLGGRARRLAAAAEAEGVESFRRREPWMRAGESARLSRREAEVLSGRLAARIAKEVALDEPEADRFGALLREELSAAFDRAHEAGGEVGRLGGEMPKALERVEGRLAAFPPEKAEKLRKALREALVR